VTFQRHDKGVGINDEARRGHVRGV
jgi:hypothetical protein